MDLFTYLLAKNGNNSAVHGDLFSYLLGKSQSQIYTVSGTTINIPDAKKLVSFMMTKESTQETTTGKNLFDKTNVILKKRLDMVGVAINLTSSDDNYYVADYIKVDANLTYTKNSPEQDAYHRVCFYTEQDESSFISYSENNTFTTPATCEYLRFCGLITELDTTQLEKGSTATAYEEYTGGIPSPNPDYPQEVKTVKGYSNLFDKNNVVYVNKKILNDSGVEINDNSGGYTKMYIEVNENEKVYISGLSSLGSKRIYYFDENKNFISRSATYAETNFEIQTPLNCKYIDIQYYIQDNDFNNYMVVKNVSENLPYVPYGNNYILYKQVGKNLFNKDDIISGSYITQDGNIRSDNTAFISNFIKIESNTNYYISGRSEWRSYAIYDKDKNFISWLATTSYNGVINISNSQCKYLRFNGELSNIDNIQFERNSTATEYEAYKESNVPIPLNNNEIVGIGDYKDELKVDKSGHVFIQKNLPKYIFTGNETIQYKGNKDGLYAYSIPVFENYKNDIEGLSNYFKTRTTYSYNNAFNSGIGLYFYIYGTSTDRILYIISDLATTVDLKTWLSDKYNNGTPVELYYVSNEPELIDLQTTVDLKLFKGANTITNSEDGYMTIQYR